MSVLLSTAYLDEAERCDRVILLHQGRLLGEGTPESFSRPLDGTQLPGGRARDPQAPAPDPAGRAAGRGGRRDRRASGCGW